MLEIKFDSWWKCKRKWNTTTTYSKEGKNYICKFLL